MSNVVVEVEDLSKCYVIRHEAAARYEGLRHAIERAVRSPVRWLRSGFHRNGATKEEFWALRGVSFQVAQGEVVGIIGRNGAGKSTLLKILSRITEPTQGRVHLRGRVASLLEVGTGFHPELTGRENIFLNGAVLGMGRQEIRRKFDEIVAFAEIDKFLDTPVKRYSSGMYVRLAFAVAAHLEPEILVVDEVLAVGDASFQKKCLGKMEDVARHGRTVLFVSHNLGVVSRLCTRSLLLVEGTKVADGNTGRTIAAYLESGFQAEGERRWEQGGPHSEKVELRSVRIVSGGESSGDVSIDEPIEIQIDFRILESGVEMSPSIHLLDSVGAEVLASVNFPTASAVVDPLACTPLPVGTYRSTCTIPKNFLNDTTYGINVAFIGRANQVELFEREAIRFRTHDGGGMKGEWLGGWCGVVRPRLAWNTQKL